MLSRQRDCLHPHPSSFLQLGSGFTKKVLLRHMGQIEANLRPGHFGSGPIVLGAVTGDLRTIKPWAVERPGKLKGEPFR